MLSLPDARRLLERARDIDGLLQCAAPLGFTRSTPVGLELQEKLGLKGIADQIAICDGPGALRGLTLIVKAGAPMREILTTVAAHLSSSVPHLLWIVFSSDGESHVGISVWRSGGARPRVCALLLDRGRISDSDAQTYCQLSAISSSSDSLTHLRWTEILGREAVTIRFFRALQGVIANLSDSISPGIVRETSRNLSLIYVSRLLFLSFIENKGWLNRDHDFLSNTFIQCMTTGGSFHRKVLTPLFFGTLNTPIPSRALRARAFGSIPFLNGGLFGRSEAERALRFEFPDDSLGLIFGELLTRFRFTGREQSADLSDSAIDPEILGRAFESLMQTDYRKSSGAFYTPHAVVQLVADASLEAAMEGAVVPRTCIHQMMNGLAISKRDAHPVLDQIERLRILDPACGSGAFLVYILEKIAGMRALCGDNRSSGNRRREVLANTIFGVDINPTAVWLCELRLWLSVVVDSEADDPSCVVPLPNLDRNIRIGDSLGAKPRRRSGALPCRRVERTRLRYVRSAGARKKLLARLLERLERRHAMELVVNDLEMIAAERRDLLAASRSRNLFGERIGQSQHRERLATLRQRRNEANAAMVGLRNGAALPFSFETHFPVVMNAGGFDLVVGNPPWVRIHQVSRSSRESFKRDFELCRGRGWNVGAARANASSGFANQLDLSALFVERSVNIVRDGGAVALLLPAKLWKSLAGGSVRSFILRTCEIQRLEDFSAARAQFDATTYPSLLVARKCECSVRSTAEPLRAVVHRRNETLNWSMSDAMLPLDQSTGSPWLLVPRQVRCGFDKLAACGIPLAESHFGRPLLGVKTGSNDAFIMKLLSESGTTAQMGAQDREIMIEANLLRRVIKGDAIDSWRVRPSQERIVWAYDAQGQPLQMLPPLASAWFQAWRKVLSARTDARTDTQSWRLFRTESANSSEPRVVWSDIGRSPRAAVIQAGDEAIPLNTCYVVRCKSLDDANALAVLLNSPLSAAWLSLVAEPAQGGYRRYLGWTMAMLPIPRNWERSRNILSKMYEQAQNGETPAPSEVFRRTLRAYALKDEDVEDMMMWAQS